MSLVETRHDQLFPVLGAAQMEVAARFASGAERRLAPGALAFSAGERNAPAFLVTEGVLEVVARSGETATPITRHGPGEIAGELSQIAGAGSLAEGRAGPEGCRLLPFDAPHLRALLIGSAEIGEVIMRAFILRRTSLIQDGGGSILMARSDDPHALRLESFLARNGLPFEPMDPAADEDARALAERLGLAEQDLPAVLAPDGALLRRPDERELGLRLGLTPELDPDEVHDVAVVGAGPAGLATAVYAASEGLSALVLDARAFGGQAGASTRIENYLGFPTGISGQALAGRAFSQAQKFGAQIAIPTRVETLECGGPSRKPGDLFGLRLADGSRVQARSVVIASGAIYRRPPIEGLERFEGAGVSYWASALEARLCAGETVALVGGGNSAGQAIVYLAPRVKRLHLVVRGEGLEATMSKYLIDRIRALPNVELHAGTEVVALEGDERGVLTAATFRTRADGATFTTPLRHLFLFIGAEPNTEWLKSCEVELDAKGFVCTGGEGASEAWRAAGRSPLALETTVPGVFAIGDVRAGSTKRVAAAVGEGAAVVAALHKVLAPG